MAQLKAKIAKLMGCKVEQLKIVKHDARGTISVGRAKYKYGKLSVLDERYTVIEAANLTNVLVELERRKAGQQKEFCGRPWPEEFCTCAYHKGAE